MSDLDDLSLLPRRPLPTDVRDRLRATVLGRPHARPTSNRMALVVAAGVALLALGATVLTQVIAGSHGTGATRAGTGASESLAVAVQPELDRCWSAIAKTIEDEAAVPARPDWQAMFAATQGDLMVIAVRAPERPFFCATTRTTVVVSNPTVRPAHAAGSRTAALLSSTAGVVAGVMDPGWPDMTLQGTDESGTTMAGDGYFQNGIFIEFTGIAGPTTQYTVTPPVAAQSRPNHPVALPAAPAALVAAVDRPDPPADRTSPAGNALGTCIAHTDWAVPDPDSWQPMEMLAVGNTSLVLARSASSTAVCSAVDQHATDAGTPVNYVFQPTGALTTNKPLRTIFDEVVTSYPPAQSWVALGAVRPDVTGGEIILPTGKSIPVAIENNTFAVVYGPAPDSQPWRQVTVILRDKTGRELYHAPVQVGP